MALGQQEAPDLDNPRLFAEIDRQGACQRLFDLAGQCRAAWDVVMNWTPPRLPFPPRVVAVAGLGGSAIGGDLLRALAAPLAPLPIVVHRDYGLPAHVGPHTLVIASSYSGNTEETLSAATEAHRRGSPLIAVTTGGRLAAQAEQWDAAVLGFDYPAQPREALGYSLMLLLGILVRLDLLPDPTPEVEGVIGTLEQLRRQVELDTPREKNPAKELAAWLYGHLPLVCGSGILSPVARRWKTQFNENSKSWAAYEELPEMDHNAVSGTANPTGLAARARGVFLYSDLEHPRNRIRGEVTRRLYEQRGIACRSVSSQGASPLAHALSSVLLGDATSYYLAILYQADPTAIPAITALKEALARS